MLMSCKLIFPKITLGASTAAQTPPTPLGPRSCQTPCTAGPGARPGLSTLGAGRAWPPSSHGRIRPCCPSLSPARPRSRPHPSQGCRSRGSIRETQGWGCSSPDSKAQLTSLQDDTEDGDTPQGWSRNLRQGISSGALPASPPPSQHGWGLQTNTSHQPPHFGHEGWEQIPELCLHSLRGGKYFFNRVLSASSLSRRAPVRGSGLCLGFPSRAAKLSRAAARDAQHSFTPSPRDTPRLSPGGKHLEEESTTHRLGLPSLPPHRPALLPPLGVFP